MILTGNGPGERLEVQMAVELTANLDPDFPVIEALLEGDKESATRRIAEVLERRVRPDVPTLLESVQSFVRRETTRPKTVTRD